MVLDIATGEIFRCGVVELTARADDGIQRGVVFIPFAYVEAAANLLTNAALDPMGKIPEFKYCAVKVTKGGAKPQHSSYGGGQALSREAEASTAPR